MKQFSCGDVVEGCDARWTCSTDDELLALVGAHAIEVHGMTEVPDALVEQVRSKIVTMA